MIGSRIKLGTLYQEQINFFQNGFNQGVKIRNKEK